MSHNDKTKLNQSSGLEFAKEKNTDDVVFLLRQRLVTEVQG